MEPVAFFKGKYFAWRKYATKEVSKWLGPRFYKWLKDGQKNSSHGLPLVITSNHNLGRAEDFVQSKSFQKKSERKKKLQNPIPFQWSL